MNKTILSMMRNLYDVLINLDVIYDYMDFYEALVQGVPEVTSIDEGLKNTSIWQEIIMQDSPKYEMKSIFRLENNEDEIINYLMPGVTLIAKRIPKCNYYLFFEELLKALEVKRAEKNLEILIQKKDGIVEYDDIVFQSKITSLINYIESIIDVNENSIESIITVLLSYVMFAYTGSFPKKLQAFSDIKAQYEERLCNLEKRMNELSIDIKILKEKIDKTPSPYL